MTVYWGSFFGFSINDAPQVCLEYATPFSSVGDSHPHTQILSIVHMWKRRKIHDATDPCESFTGCGELMRVELIQQCGFPSEIIPIILLFANARDMCEHRKVHSNQPWCEWTESETATQPGTQWRLIFLMQRSCGLGECRTCAVSAMRGWIQRKPVAASDYEPGQFIFCLDNVCIDRDKILFSSSQDDFDFVQVSRTGQDVLRFQGQYDFQDGRGPINLITTLANSQPIAAYLLVAAHEIHQYIWRHFWIMNQ